MIMTKKKNRNYKREYAIYHGKPEQIKRRAQRNAARRTLERLGRVRKGDGKDVHHRDHRTSNNTLGNLAIMAKSKNRSLNKQRKIRK